MVSPFRTAEERLADREEKRQALLLAAVRRFNENGFHATALEDVAASLGVSKPTIYHYLGNKEQVLIECVTCGVEQLRAAADRARLEAGTGLDRLRGFLRRYAAIAMDDFGRCVIRTGDEQMSPSNAHRFRMLKREIDLAMRELIADGVKDGSIVAADIRLTAFTLAGALNWIARWQRPGEGASAEDIAANMVDILTIGLSPRQG